MVGSDVPSLNRVALTSLSVLVRSYLPLLHYKDELKDVAAHPLEHTFGFRTCFKDRLSIHDLCDPLPSYMRPRAVFSADCASLIHEFCAKNMDVLFKAFVDNHPRVESAEPQQNRRSSDNQLQRLVAMRYLWPYDGYEMTLDSWEHRHHILCSHLLVC